MKRKLFILCGLPFSGKSTLAQKLVNQFGWTRIDLDEIKFSMFGASITDDEIDQTGWDQVYEEMYHQIEQLLTESKTVIHDTGNFTRKERESVRAIASKIGLESLTIFIDTPAEIARKRLIENRISPTRFDVSDTDFNSTVKEIEPPDSTEPHLCYLPTDSFEEWANKLSAV